jgi:hypothetical protein
VSNAKVLTVTESQLIVNFVDYRGLCETGAIIGMD